MSVWRAKRETTSTEFLKWKVKLDSRWERHDKTDYYLAQIASMILRVNMKKDDAAKFQTEDLLLNFKLREDAREKTEEEIRADAEVVRAGWETTTGNAKDISEVDAATRAEREAAIKRAMQGIQEARAEYLVEHPEADDREGG